ncbi:hypothetical protein PCIT_a2314 [Pseudoalteromonas citrea]|uniref:Aminoglycoside phosphotransferase domain-containing protein n=2 Tax=Pseudoalteromonas citrea TaxID=43655 RepID=A0AAD4AJJ7_9GAMM|nr:phosphotransferase [Pseudoalteromonas citrea]KAF7772272.1 hypothetical protein PCIT_a2314 [Pseudoalteromonas citrea]
MLLQADLISLAQSMLPTLRVDDITYLDKGLSNKNFLLQTSKGKLLLKCYQDEIPVWLLKIQSALADLGISQSLIAYDFEKKVALLEFIDEVAPFFELDLGIIECLVTLHEYQDVDSTAPINILGFVKQLNTGSNILAEHHISWAISLIEALPQELAFCHNDLVFDNLLNTEHGAKIIDFEYAQYNDVYFDLAALSCSFNLDTQEQCALLKTYYIHRHLPLPHYANNKLLAYQVVYLLLSIEWYQSRGAHSYASPLIARLQSLV